MITTLETYHRLNAIPADRTWLAAKAPGAGNDRTMPTGNTDDSVAANARVEQGRWIVDCPWCSGAELGSHVDGLFFCCNCRNRAVGHAYIRVVFPAGRAKLEARLVKLDVAEQNWTGE